MNLVVATALVITGIIHLLPAIGVVSASRLHALYGIELGDESLILLMRHRAVLFGLLGAFFIYAAFAPGYRSLAFIAGLVSVLSFLLIAQPWTGPGDTWPVPIRRVIQADILALICLVVGGVTHLVQRSSE